MRCLSLVLAVGVMGAGLQAPARCESRSPAPGSLVEDRRLDRKVTVSAGRVYLGELLEALSRRAGVPLSVDDAKGPVSGHHLAVFVRERSLREVMRGLQELFAQRFDRWEWQAARNGGGYVLRHQLAPEAAATAMREAMLRRWAADLKSYHEIARLPEDVRAARAAARPELFGPPPLSGRRLGMLDLFARLAPAQVEQLQRGLQVAPDARAASPREADALTFGVRGGGGDEPAAPVFYADWTPQFSGPVLWMRSGDHAVNVIGGALWDSGWFRTEGEGWRHAGDPEAQAFLRQRAGGDPAAGAAITVDSISHWIQKVAETQGMEMIVDLVYPRGAQVVRRGWMGRSAEQTVHAFLLEGGLTHKREGAIHLLRDRSATVHPRQHLLPWTEVRKFRESAARGGGYLDLPALARLCGLTGPRLTGLAEEFPDAEPETLDAWKPIFAFREHLDGPSAERLARPEGLPIREAGLLARQALSQGPDPRGLRNLPLLEREFQRAFVSLRVGRAQVLEQKPGEARQEVDGRVLGWEVRLPDGPAHRRTLRLRPRKPLQPEPRSL